MQVNIFSFWSFSGLFRLQASKCLLKLSIRSVLNPQVHSFIMKRTPHVHFFTVFTLPVFLLLSSPSLQVSKCLLKFPGFLVLYPQVHSFIVPQQVSSSASVNKLYESIATCLGQVLVN